MIGTYPGINATIEGVIDELAFTIINGLKLS